MKKLLLALALLLVPTAVNAQCNGVFANNTVCGNITGASNLPRPTNPSAFLGAAGGTNGQIQYNNAGALGGFTASGAATINTNTGVVTLTPGAANTLKGSLNGTTVTDIAVPSCATALQWTAATGFVCASVGTATPAFATRTDAAALDLSAYTVIQTLGYAAGGDGGGATFIKTASAFIDSFIATGSITTNGTSGCTNGNLFGQIPNSPNTQGFQSAFTIVVAGNVVTTIQNNAPGNGYAAGTVLTFTVPGCSGSVTWTINTVTTPSGSFTDTAGNKWQIVYPANGLDARAMGVKFDWTVAGGDAGATDNFTTLQNAINFAAYAPGFIDTGSSNGGRVLLARNTAKFCGSNGAVPLKVWNGVTVEGQGSTASVLKVCDTWINTTNFVELCDVASHVSCFGASLRHLQIFALFSLGTGSVSPTTQAAVYTNSCQQSGCGVYDAIIYSGACRRGIWAELGFGGASLVTLIDEVEIKGGEKSSLCGGGTPGAVVISGYISTQITINKLTLSGLSTSSGFGPRDLGLVITGGFVNVKTVYAEQVVTGVFINIPTSLTNGMVHIDGSSGGPDCVNGVTRQSGSIANSVKLEMAFANSCTNTYNNAGAGSGAITQLADVVF